VEKANECNAIIEENILKYREILKPFKPEEVASEIALIDAVQNSLEAYDEKVTPFLSGIAMDTERYTEAYLMLKEGGELNSLALPVDEAISNLIKYNVDYTADQIAANGKQASSSITIMSIGIVIGVILAIMVGLFIFTQDFKTDRYACKRRGHPGIR